MAESVEDIIARELETNRFVLERNDYAGGTRRILAALDAAGFVVARKLTPEIKEQLIQETLKSLGGETP